MAASLRKLSSRLQKTNEQLKNLQNPVKTEMINVKVLMEFRTATERASRRVRPYSNGWMRRAREVMTILMS
jgi:hypothetical protein